MTTLKNLPNVFRMTGLLETLIVRKVSDDCWQVFLSDNRGRITEYDNEEIVEKVEELKRAGYRKGGN